MYDYTWDEETGGYVLQPTISSPQLEVRPVFFEELDLLGFDRFWEYPRGEMPLLWAQGRQYFYRGELVAETIGGRLFVFPQVKVYKKSLKLRPVDIQGMIAKNHDLMDGLVKETLEKTYVIFKKYQKKSYFSYVAFSGGKDSLVLLDLVQRTLSPDDFVVIFADTTMEFSETYRALDRARRRWPAVRFYVVRAAYDARETWRIFGPPSRTLRWCCSVHKSAPSLLLLRELVGKSSLKALAFDGIRAEESLSRATYTLVNMEAKHITQVNCSPLLEWGSSELYLYLFAQDLLLNRCYRYGMTRVGCVLCPYGSPWREFIAGAAFGEEVRPFVDILHEVFASTIPQEERENYIIQGKWKGRNGGRNLNKVGNRVVEVEEGSGAVTLHLREKHSPWQEWMKILSFHTFQGKSYIRWNEALHEVKVVDNGNGLTVKIWINLQDIQQRKLYQLVKDVCHKIAYCQQCQVCMVECPVGALEMEQGKLLVREDLCTHCTNCLRVRQGCLIADSLSVKGGNVAMHKIRGYKTFGLRREWVQYLFEFGEAFWGSPRLGSAQIEACKELFREAGLTDTGKKNSLTDLAKKLSRLGADDVRVWAIILVNLAYNSGLIRWFLFATDVGREYTSEELLDMMGETLPRSTRENARQSLHETFKFSPLGNELGLGICRFKGKQVVAVTHHRWANPDAHVVLYALYKFAEEAGGVYSFTLRQLLDDHPERKGISPAKIFGLTEEELRAILQGLSLNHPDFIKVVFTRDLDNVNLSRDKSCLDVVDLFC